MVRVETMPEIMLLMVRVENMLLRGPLEILRRLENFQTLRACTRKDSRPPQGGGPHWRHLESYAEAGRRARRRKGAGARRPRKPDDAQSPPPPVRRKAMDEPGGGKDAQGLRAKKPRAPPRCGKRCAGRIYKEAQGPRPAYPPSPLCLANTTGDNAAEDQGGDGGEHGEKHPAKAQVALAGI